MSQYLEIEDIWLELLTVCWESVSSELLFAAESTGKDANYVPLTTLKMNLMLKTINYK